MRPMSWALSIPVFFMSLRLVLDAQGHLGLQVALILVDDDGEDDDGALDDVLPELGDAAHGHAVVEHADDEGADEGAAYGADAAGHGGAAEDGGRDGVHLPAVAAGGPP